jgi:hypothetical protein
MVTAYGATTSPPGTYVESTVQTDFNPFH